MSHLNGAREKWLIEVDPRTKAIRVGNWEADNLYYNYPIQERHANPKREILVANGIEQSLIPGSDKHLGYQQFHAFTAAYLGARFYAQLKKVFVDTWIDPIRPFLDQYCRYSSANGTRYLPGQVVRAWSCQDHYQWLERYQLTHLTPLVVFFAIPPVALKQAMGKAAWRQLCQLSKSKIGQLVKLLCDVEHWHVRHLKAQYPSLSIRVGQRAEALPPEAFQFYLGRLLRWMPFKSATLKYCLSSIVQEQAVSAFGWEWEYDPDPRDRYARIVAEDQELLWLEKHGTPSRKSAYMALRMLVADTRRMSETVGRRFEWCSARQMRIRHNTYAHQIRQERLAALRDTPGWNVKFDWMQPYQHAISQAKLPGVSAVVLNTTEQIWLESSEMSHCVIDFLEECQQGEMLVLRLQSSRERSTLGFTRDSRDGDWYLFQHYGYNNTAVSCQFLQRAVAVISCVLDDVA